MTTKEFRKKWIEALRSGKYKQSKGRLRTEDGFCCLGVACDLIVSEKILDLNVENTYVTNADGRTYLSYSYDNELVYLPYSVKVLIGLTNSFGNFYIKSINVGEESSLAYENDIGTPFSEIADIIESEPEGLFVNT